MDAETLLNRISTGPSDKVFYRTALPHKDEISQELAAMSNSSGGIIILGVDEVTGMINGLISEQLRGYDWPITQAADHLESCVYVFTEVVSINVEGSNKFVLVINVKEGVNKPHRTPKGEVFIKQGAGRRLLTDKTEIMRWFNLNF